MIRPEKGLRSVPSILCTFPSPQLIILPSINKYWDTTQALFHGFIIEAPSPCPPTLSKPSLSTMIFDNTTVLNAVMAILSINISTRQASSFYKVPYRNILNVTTELESIQEQSVTTLVENDNQQGCSSPRREKITSGYHNYPLKELNLRYTYFSQKHFAE